MTFAGSVSQLKRIRGALVVLILPQNSQAASTLQPSKGSGKAQVQTGQGFKVNRYSQKDSEKKRDRTFQLPNGFIAEVIGANYFIAASPKSKERRPFKFGRLDSRQLYRPKFSLEQAQIFRSIICDYPQPLEANAFEQMASAIKGGLR